VTASQTDITVCLVNGENAAGVAVATSLGTIMRTTWDQLESRRMWQMGSVAGALFSPVGQNGLIGAVEALM